jgi:hypothetical protein
MVSEHGERSVRTVPAERIQAGDHAGMACPDREVQWQVLTTYTWAGLADGHKVVIVLDPNDLRDDEIVTHLDAGSGMVETAMRTGQLALKRTPSFYLPDGRFDRERQCETIAGEIERAHREGWSHLRLAGDMSWAVDQGLSDEEVLDYEASVGPVFADGRYTAMCWYDRRRFSDYLVAAAQEIHPVFVMERLGAIDVAGPPDAEPAAASAALSASGQLTESLDARLKRLAARGVVEFDLDLTDLSFMEAHGASQLISFAASLPDGGRVTVRCGPLLELLLRGLGCDTVPQLELNVVGDS